MARAVRSPAVWHALAIVALGGAFEGLFIHHGINALDEGWALYAAKRLHEGGALYRDVSWAFPPGHVLPAWVGYAIGAPGIVPARILYAVFCVALSLAIYFLGRRLMPPAFALLAAAMLQVGAASSHAMQYLFAFRYLVLSVVALLLFAARLRTGDRRWMVLAGLVTGVAAFFRVDALAVVCGIGIAVLAVDRDWRGWLRDWGAFALGLSLWLGPVLVWFGSSVGLATFFHEIFVRPLAMLQALPWPEVVLPRSWDRWSISVSFVTLQFRAWWFLYAGYAAVLLGLWMVSLSRGERFGHVLLLAVVTWGAFYFTRTLGRSDTSHLDSAMPPVCLLLAHLLSLGFRRVWPSARAGRVRAEMTVCLAALAAWIFLWSADGLFDVRLRGTVPLRSTQGTIAVVSAPFASTLDGAVLALRRHTRPTDLVLDLTASPILYVLAERGGPGYFDVVMPGTFVSKEEERGFLARLESNPPAAVLWPRRAFDNMTSRSLAATAPMLAKWVAARYERREEFGNYILMLPRDRAAEHDRRLRLR